MPKSEPGGTNPSLDAEILAIGENRLDRSIMRHGMSINSKKIRRMLMYISRFCIVLLPRMGYEGSRHGTSPIFEMILCAVDIIDTPHLWHWAQKDSQRREEESDDGLHKLMFGPLRLPKML